MSTSTPEYDIFRQLAQIFSNRHRKNQVLEVEILQPGLGLGPLLQDGCSIGITKKALVQAFVVARRIFFDRLVSMSDGDDMYMLPTHADAVVSREQEDKEEDFFPVSVVSEIILLFDCEHLTACNWRKKRLTFLIRRIDPARMDDAERDKVVRTLETELTLITTYICSPLHRHTKSPTLWQHRLWVLTQLIRVRGWAMKESVTSRERNGFNLETAQDLLKTELAIVLRAGELHPKNYYAFAYMRRLHGVLADAIEEPGNCSAELARSMLNPTLDWCLSHPRDISGWMFVLYLLEAIQAQNFRIYSINKVAQFALDVGWEGESLWTFVDLGTRRFGLVEAIQDTLRSNQVTRPTDFSAQERVVDNVSLPEKPWKVWLARAREYWTAGVGSSRNGITL